MNFVQKFESAAIQNNSLLCVGLDADFEKIPEHLKSRQFPLFDFNKEIIDATNDVVCAYKPNIAFYEAGKDGLVGLLQLKKTIEYITSHYPLIPVILDAKNADIDNTNKGYASFAFDYLKVDSITLHPYLGRESLKPFLDRSDKGLFILCRTSNKGASEFQDLTVSGIPLYQVVAQHVAKEWNTNNNCGLVVGATYPKELEIVRNLVGDTIPFLIPGVGAQGADIEKTVTAGITKNKLGAIINSSRSILYASSGEDFSLKAREETIKLRDQINLFRK